jgi:hypothetical protein
MVMERAQNTYAFRGRGSAICYEALKKDKDLYGFALRRGRWGFKILGKLRTYYMDAPYCLLVDGIKTVMSSEKSRHIQYDSSRNQPIKRTSKPNHIIFSVHQK